MNKKQIKGLPFQQQVSLLFVSVIGRDSLIFRRMFGRSYKFIDRETNKQAKKCFNNSVDTIIKGIGLSMDRCNTKKDNTSKGYR